MRATVYDIKEFVEKRSLESGVAIYCAECRKEIVVGQTYVAYESLDIYACDYDCAGAYINDSVAPPDPCDPHE